MRTLIASLLLLIPALPLSAQAAGEGEIITETAYVLPVFQDLPSSQQREVTRQGTPETYEEARRDSRFVLRKLRYRSDGLQVVAYLYAPASPGNERRPAIVYNRGSWVMGDQAPALAPVFHRLASAGFVAGEGHTLDGRGEERDRMAIEWFRRHMQAPQGPASGSASGSER